ncbi:MAG: serine hydrolase domain-containing protein [Bacteriovoracaceae bacterium]|jgi:CubicO group peptidase (beta-lactamase class C family)|nr:serine hydrolase domain-containing protein [Bacteriovoracaceae bacterium]
MKFDRLKEVEQKIPKILEDCEIPGVSIGIVRGNEMIYAKGFGLAKINSDKRVDEKSLYSIGSATKPFTACGVAMLADRGKIKLNSPIVDYYPSLEFMNEKLTQKVTFIDLLTHRTGLPRHDWYWAFSTRSRQELVDGLKYLVPWEKFRSKFQYNNIMYMLAGYLIEIIEKKEWEQFIKDEFFLPLEMKSSGFHELHKGRKNRAFAHNKKDDELKVIKEFGFGAIAPAGSIVSNVEDMCKWISLHLSKGRLIDHQLYSKSVYKKIFKPYIESNKNFSEYFKEFDQEYYGLGWRIHNFKGEKLCWHGGGTEGFRSFTGFLPYHNYGIVVLANSVRHTIRQDGACIIACYLLDLLTSKGMTNWLKKYSDLKK